MRKRIEEEKISECTFVPLINARSRSKNGFAKTSEFVKEGIDNYMQRV